MKSAGLDTPKTTKTVQLQARFIERPARNLALVASSIAVVGIIALFLIGPQAARTVSFSLSSYSITGHDVVVYGKVADGSRHPAVDAEVRMYRVLGGREHLLSQVRTNSHGIYRVAFSQLHQMALRVQVSETARGHRYQGAVRISVRSGRAYEISTILARRGYLIFLPVFSY